MEIIAIAAVLGAAALYVLGSMVYVYRFRGATRFESVTEYLRKGWPIFSPMNCVLYATTKSRARRAILDLEQFEDLQEIQRNWRTISEEAVALRKRGLFDSTNKPESDAYYDIGFRTFYKYGWSKFYLKWYGTTHKSAKELCPRTVEILDRVRSVNGAMLSILPPGSKLTRHMDPVACSLRYHLGLATPNSDACFINVDGTTYSWRDGEALLFDETYLHFARNDSDRDRIILMCDVERPMFFPGRAVNFFNKLALRASVVPNVPGDRRGVVNVLFTAISPILRRTRALKETNRWLYRLIQWTVNLGVILLALALLAGLVLLGYWLWTSLSAS